MFDFHIHVAACGDLLPGEAMRLARNVGFKAVGLVVRADQATLSLLLPPLLLMVRDCSLYAGLDAFAGVELVQVPPALFPTAVTQARDLGAELVLGHGESVPFLPAASVERGTNLAAIEAGVDILAHPGLITEEDAIRAAELGVLLELSLAAPHSLANGHVAAMAARHGCGLVTGSGARTPEHFTRSESMRILYRTAAIGAGTPPELPETCAHHLVQKLLRRNMHRI